MINITGLASVVRTEVTTPDAPIKDLFAATDNVIELVPGVASDANRALAGETTRVAVLESFHSSSWETGIEVAAGVAPLALIAGGEPAFGELEVAVLDHLGRGGAPGPS